MQLNPAAAYLNYQLPTRLSGVLSYYIKMAEQRIPAVLSNFVLPEELKGVFVLGTCCYHLSLIILHRETAILLFLWVKMWEQKSVRVHFAYGRIALTLELLGQFGRFLDEDDHCNPPVLLVPFSRLLGL